MPDPKPDDNSAKRHALSGVFLYTYRTPMHMRNSSQQVFQQAVDGVSRFLTSKNVPVRKIVQAAASHNREQGTNEDYENLSMSHSDQAQSVAFDQARAAGARYVLVLVVDRPVAAFVKLRAQCFDLSGKLVWEIQSADHLALTAKGALARTLQGLEDKIAGKADELRLALDEVPAPVAVATSTPPNTPGQSEIVPAQPSPTGGEKPPSEPAPGVLTIEKGAPVSLLLVDAVSTQGGKVGDQVRFRVIDPVVIDHLVVVPEGAEATGTVTALQPPRRRLRSAEMTITIQQLALLNGNKAPLNAVWRVRRHLSPEHPSRVVDEVFETYWLALPFVPFQHGDHVNVAKGTEFSAAFAERVTLDRAELELLQPAAVAPPTGPATLTFYDVDRHPTAHPSMWCGKFKLGELRAGTHYKIELPAGTYWVRTDSKKSAFSIVLEPGKEYFIQVSSFMTSGKEGNPGYTHHIAAVRHAIGEIQVADTRPLGSKQYHDFSKADPGLLRAHPSE